MQLRMLYAPSLTAPPENFTPEGFEIRSLREDELAEWGEILHPACGFSSKSPEYFQEYLPKVIPGGIKAAFEKSTSRLAASAVAQYQECGLPGGLGWVMTHPELRGRKLGAAVTAAAMNHGVGSGLKFMCLATDDFRIPAISIYLKFGWRPFLYAEDMAERWKKVCADLNLAPSSLEDYSLDEENNIIVNHTLA